MASEHVVGWLLDLLRKERIGRGAVLVYLYLLKTTQEPFHHHCSVAQIARETGLGHRTVQEACRDLGRRRIIDVRQRRVADMPRGPVGPNRYVILKAPPGWTGESK